MTPIAAGSVSETEHLGHNASPAPSMPPGTYPHPAPKKGGCGCGCFSGCLLILLLIAGFFAAVYFFGFQNDRYIGHIDRVVVWAYEGAIRPKLVSQSTAGLRDKDQTRFLRRSDLAIEKYLGLQPAEKKALLTESAVALWYLQNGDILPPEKIPHLKRFVESLNMEDDVPPPKRDYPPPPPPRQPKPPRQLQELPRRPIIPPKNSPRLLN